MDLWNLSWFLFLDALLMISGLVSKQYIENNLKILGQLILIVKQQLFVNFLFFIHLEMLISNECFFLESRGGQGVGGDK